MKKVLIVMLMLAGMASTYAQTGVAKAEDLGPLVFNAVKANNPSLMDNIVPDQAAAKALLGKEGETATQLDEFVTPIKSSVSDVYGSILKEGVAVENLNPTVTVSNTDTKNGIAHAKLTIDLGSIALTADCAKLNGKWFIVSNVSTTTGGAKGK